MIQLAPFCERNKTQLITAYSEIIWIVCSHPRTFISVMIRTRTRLRSACRSLHRCLYLLLLFLWLLLRDGDFFSLVNVTREVPRLPYESDFFSASSRPAEAALVVSFVSRIVSRFWISISYSLMVFRVRTRSTMQTKMASDSPIVLQAKRGSRKQNLVRFSCWASKIGDDLLKRGCQSFYLDSPRPTSRHQTGIQ